ncbi:MAG: DUF898 domain-containing protein [Burkholderiales bacterium]|nr:DUF898 domain-containing protein [Burkholderiales bacterium]
MSEGSDAVIPAGPPDAESDAAAAPDGDSSAAPATAVTAAPPDVAASSRETRYPFSFTGRAADYFRIWVVNTFLLIVTLGLYSPWAKVRKRQFFLRHTWAADANFDFHANPWPILRGRLIAGLLFAAYWFWGNVNPKHAAWLGLALAAATPWLAVSSLRFNLGNTSYRNLRFRFSGGLRDSLGVFWPFVLFAGLTLLFPFEVDAEGWGREQWKGLVPSLVLMLFYPWFVGAYRLMLLRRSGYGAANLGTTARVRQIYAVYARAGLLFLALALPAAVANGLLVVLLKPRLSDPAAFTQWTTQILFLLNLLPWAAVAICAYAYTQSRLANVTLCASHLEVPPPASAAAGQMIRLHSTLRMRTLLKLYVLNLLAIVGSVGFAMPWAAVRSARVRAESMALLSDAPLDTVLAQDGLAGAAAADAASEFFSLDVAL